MQHKDYMSGFATDSRGQNFDNTLHTADCKLGKWHWAKVTLNWMMVVSEEIRGLPARSRLCQTNFDVACLEAILEVMKLAASIENGVADDALDASLHCPKSV